jgi:Rrf2 family protein
VKLSGGVEWALHCCVVLSAATPHAVPVARLAELHDVSATYLAKQMQALSRAAIIRSAQGHAGGYVLAGDPAQITMLDVVEAIDGPPPTFACTEIRQRGPLAAPAEACIEPCAINRAMLSADQAWRAALHEITIADLAGQVQADYDADVLGSISEWLSRT